MASRQRNVTAGRPSPRSFGPSYSKETPMQISAEKSRAVATEYADEIVEAVERHLGIELSDEQYSEVSSAIEADLTEMVVDAFGEL
jgi:hypothetical protein